jgi:hypothetical protein
MYQAFRNCKMFITIKRTTVQFVYRGVVMGVEKEGVNRVSSFSSEQSFSSKSYVAFLFHRFKLYALEIEQSALSYPTSSSTKITL